MLYLDFSLFIYFWLFRMSIRFICDIDTTFRLICNWSRIYRILNRGIFTQPNIEEFSAYKFPYSYHERSVCGF